MSLAQLSKILPLPEDDLQQVIDYASNLSPYDAAEHFGNLLGETPKTLEFISSFNSRRKSTHPEQESSLVGTQDDSSRASGVPKPSRKAPKKKAPLHALPARQIQSSYDSEGRSYKKNDVEDYMSKKPAQQGVANARTTGGSSSVTGAASNFSLNQQPAERGLPVSATAPTISSQSNSSTRSSTPGPPKKKKNNANAHQISITGGTPMHGASTALSALDSAIRSLEVSTNPSKAGTSAAELAARRCSCIATRHPLLSAAPNCLSCGKVVCAKEGLGPCTFCGAPLLAPEEVQAMIRALRSERGREKMALEAASHRRAETTRTPAPFTAPARGNYEAANPRLGETAAAAAAAAAAATVANPGLSDAEQRAKEHRDRLLGFQRQNAQRTTVRDEAADWETPDAGTSMWSSPEERARQLKRQQQVLQQLEWSARPEYERRRQVVSLDVVGGKVVKKFGVKEVKMGGGGGQGRGGEAVEEEEHQTEVVVGDEAGEGRTKGTFSRNPLLGAALIKPIYRVEVESGDGIVDLDGGGVGSNGMEGILGREKKKTWRRVQDDLDNNEDVILDGGVYGKDS